MARLIGYSCCYYWHLTKESHAFLLENMVSQGEQFLSFVDERASNQYAQIEKPFTASVIPSCSKTLP